MKIDELLNLDFYLHLAENEQEDGSMRLETLLTLGKGDEKNRRHVPLPYVVELLNKKNEPIFLEKLICRYSQIIASLDGLVFIREWSFVESKSVISLNQAYELLSKVDEIEGAGLHLVTPKSWTAKQPSRAKVKIEINKDNPSKLGIGSLLRFDRRIVVGGRVLDKDEVEELLNQTQGLHHISGQWVLMDGERVKEILANWDYLENVHFSHGIPFGMALRLIARMQNHVRGRDLGDEDICDIHLAEDLARSFQKPSQRYTDDITSYMAKTGVELREYQKFGVEWLCQRVEEQWGALLCDEMGLGKTVQILAMISILRARQSVQRVLIVAPASLLENWRRESQHFLLGENHLQVIRGMQILQERDITVTSYTTLRSRPDLQSQNWDLIVLDEAQKIKNSESQTHQLLRNLKTKSWVAMTGTPIENHLRELWSIVECVLPSLLGSKEEFMEALNGQDRSTFVKRLHTVLDPFLLRRTKSEAEVAAALPEKIEKVHFVRLTPVQKALYNDCLDEMLTEIRQKSTKKFQVLPYLMKLKKICNHPDHFLGYSAFDPQDSSKCRRLLGLVQDIAFLREKFIIFTQFRSLCDPLLTMIETNTSLKGRIISGDTPGDERQRIVDQLSYDPDIHFLVLSLHATGVGLNIVAANHVIHFDRWWNPAVENQATDRAHRLGQKRTVTVHKLVSSGTIEDKVHEIILEKTKLSDDFLGGVGDGVLDMSPEQWQEWLNSMTRV